MSKDTLTALKLNELVEVHNDLADMIEYLQDRISLLENSVLYRDEPGDDREGFGDG